MSVLEIKKINYFGVYSGVTLSHDETHRWKNYTSEQWHVGVGVLESLSDHQQAFELLWDLDSSSENVDNILCLPRVIVMENIERICKIPRTCPRHSRPCTNDWFSALPLWQSGGNQRSPPASSHECAHAWEGVFFLRMTASYIINSRWLG